MQETVAAGILSKTQVLEELSRLSSIQRWNGQITFCVGSEERALPKHCLHIPFPDAA